MALTNEQNYVIDSVLCSDDGKVIAVNSIAGSGKTSTADALIRAYAPKTGFYTAFNKAIVEDSKRRFGDLIDAKTVHALAYKYVKPKKKIEELNYTTIKEPISYEEKAIIIDALDDFFRSSYIDIYNYAITKTENEVLQELIVNYANMMLEGKIPPTFNYMLKCLHLMLLHEEIGIDFDLLILDECQDTTAVTLEIFKLINAKHKVMFGDKYQNIYSFMNTVNAFDELTDITTLRLTKSFRCDPNIASIVDKYGKTYLENSFIFNGNENIEKDSTFKIAYITRTNAMLIERMYYLMNQGESFTLTRNPNEIFALPIAVLNAANGKEVYDKKYKFLEKEYKNFDKVRRSYRNFYEYINVIMEDPLIEIATKVLGNFANKRINIYDVKTKALTLKPNPNIILTTAHAFKGLEMDNVYIEDDLNISVNRTIHRINELSTIMDGNPKLYLSKEQKEDLNTYYVALSRAKTNVMNVRYLI
jgi:F-box protein, helicase, 18